jgi:SAM-dependent methyltransferase
VRYCESLFAKYGDTGRGVGWTEQRQEDLERRYQAMLGLLSEDSRRVSLLDFGCGTSHLYELIRRRERTHIDYHGLDLSQEFLAFSREKYPDVPYYDIDVMKSVRGLPTFDYIVMNGVFTYRTDIPRDEMKVYFETVVSRLFQKVRVGLAFNVMSKQVDWEREDLFHVPFDDLASFLTTRVSRHFLIRHDYGLYEYTTYVYRAPRGT